MSLYLIFVYYHRESIFSEGPSSELYGHAETLAEAEAVALGASQQYPEDEFAVEGGEFEPGDWNNPLYKGGSKIR